MVKSGACNDTYSVFQDRQAESYIVSAKAGRKRIGIIRQPYRPVDLRSHLLKIWPKTAVKPYFTDTRKCFQNALKLE